MFSFTHLATTERLLVDHGGLDGTYRAEADPRLPCADTSWKLDGKQGRQQAPQVQGWQTPAENRVKEAASDQMRDPDWVGNPMTSWEIH